MIECANDVISLYLWYTFSCSAGIIDACIQTSDALSWIYMQVLNRPGTLRGEDVFLS